MQTVGQCSGAEQEQEDQGCRCSAQTAGIISFEYLPQHFVFPSVIKTVI